MRKKLLVITLIFFLCLLSIVISQGKEVAFATSGQIVTPTLYCLGSCPTVPPQRAQVQVSVSPATSTMPSPSESGPVGSPSAAPSIAPCEANTVSVQHKGKKGKKHSKKKKGAINKGMDQLLRFLIEFINLLLRLIGGGPLPVPVPTDPVVPCEPAELPAPSDSPAPTDIPEAQPSLTSVPSIIPSPSSTTTLTNCEADPGKCGYPNKSNTGVPVGTSLTPYTGALQIKTAGTVIEGKDIKGCLDIEAPGVIIRKSKITCTSYYGVLTREKASTGDSVLIEDVEIACGGNTTGISGQNITARRVYVHDCENGFSVNKNVTVEDSFVPNAVEVNGGHGDAMQFAAPVSNIVVRHNTLFAHNATAAVNWTGTDQTVNMLVENNLLAGGAYTIYCPRGTVPANGFRVLNNRFGKYTYGYASECNNSGTVFTGNYKDADLSTIQP